MASEQVQKVATELEECVNAMGNGENMAYLASKMANMHSTLAQSFTGKFIVPFVKKMAEKYEYGDFDMRDKAACIVCDAMWKALKDGGLTYRGEWLGLPQF